MKVQMLHATKSISHCIHYYSCVSVGATPLHDGCKVWPYDLAFVTSCMPFVLQGREDNDLPIPDR